MWRTERRTDAHATTAKTAFTHSVARVNTKPSRTRRETKTTPKWIRLGLERYNISVTDNWAYQYTATRSSADADKPAWRVYRSVKVTKHSTIPYVNYTFLLCSGNFVFKTCRFCARRLSVERYSYSDVAGWLAGWVAGCPSHSGTVSTRLNLSENFFDHLKAPSF